ncbi:MAG: response regulator transcription factor [Burkholderiales bacterium]|nr:response regulator transcription factor [Burkholderiales bacterium]
MFPATTLRVVVIDDHALFREGLALLLTRTRPGVVINPFPGCETALEWLERNGAADLALVDLLLPGMPGMQGLALLRERWPQMPVVALSSDDSPATIRAALDRGAMAFIPKSASAAELMDALAVVLFRGVYVPQQAALADGSGPHALPPRTPAHDAPGVAPQALGMTPRQADVLRLILQGKSAKLICRELGLSEGTVKTHTSAVLRVLNVTTRTQAVIAAGRLGLRFDL